MNQPPKPEPPRAELWCLDKHVGWINHDGTHDIRPEYTAHVRRMRIFWGSIAAIVGLLLLGAIASHANGAEATDIRTIDGDTFSASIDLGFGVVLKDQTVRLYGFDAWENSKHRRTLKLSASEWENELRKGENAYRALNGILKTAKKVEVRETQGRDPWGRLLLDVWADGQHVGDVMKSKGHERK